VASAAGVRSFLLVVSGPAHHEEPCEIELPKMVLTLLLLLFICRCDTADLALLVNPGTCQFPPLCELLVSPALVCVRLFVGLPGEAVHLMCIMTVHRLDEIPGRALALRVLALLHLCDLGVRCWYGLILFQRMWIQAHLN